MVNSLNPSVHYIIGPEQVSQTKFDFHFPVLNTSDVKVVLGEGQEVSIYTVMTNAEKNGGYIDFPNPFPVGTRVIIYREMVYSRQTQFRENEDFHASVINEEFDRMVMLLQQSGKASKDSLRQAKHDVPIDMILPSAESRADKILGFDSSGRPHVLFDPSESAKDAEKSAILSKKNAEQVYRHLCVVEEISNAFEVDNLAQRDASNIDVPAYKTKLSLGDASCKNVGTNPGEIPALDTNGKLPSSVYEAGGLSTKVLATRSSKFFVRNADGSLPSGVFAHSVWSLSDQKLSFGGMPPYLPIYIELPTGLNRFRLGAGGAGGSRGFSTSSRGGTTELHRGYFIYSAFSSANLRGLQSGNFYRDLKVQSPAGGEGDSSTIVHYGKGAVGGSSAISSKESSYDGENGGMIEFVLDLNAGEVMFYFIGAGGYGHSSINHPSEYGRSESANGANGFIEVEYA